MRKFATVLIAVFAWLIVARWAFALEPMSVRLVGEESGFSGLVTARIEARIKQSPADLMLVDSDRLSSAARQVVILVGSKGWRSLDSIAPDISVLAVLPPRHLFDSAVATSNRPMLAIYGEMAPSRMLNFVSIFLQLKKSPTVSLVAGPQTQAHLSRLETLASEKGIRLLVERIDREIEVGTAVERLTQHAGVLLALPDPVAHTASTVSPILMMTYRAGVPVIAYSEPYLKAGATAALYATPDQIASQVIETLTSLRQSKSTPTTQYLKYFTVGVNQTVARSLGLALPSLLELESKLKGMRE